MIVEPSRHAAPAMRTGIAVSESLGSSFEGTVLIPCPAGTCDKDADKQVSVLSTQQQAAVLY